ncbi:MAG: endodeoxyribonuclease [Colwellia sp.]|nr:endodeoxyribonuclease [Colwellia sp.]
MEITCEKWKPVVRYEGLYEVSSFGRIRSITRTVWNSGPKCFQTIKGCVRKLRNSNGYLNLTLVKDGVTKVESVHRIVAEAFLDNYSDSLDVNHKNCIKKDNRVENIEMVTRSQNIKHAWDNGRMKLNKRLNGRFISNKD